MSAQKNLDFLLLFLGITWNIDLIKSQDAELTLTPPFQQYVRAVGSSQIVVCKTSDNYESLRWLDPARHTVRVGPVYNDEHRPHVESSDGLVLVFDRLEHSDAGNWTCTLGSTDAKLSFEMIIVEPIIFEENVKTKMVTRGDKVLLPCKASGNPEPEISWYRNGSKIVNQARGPRKYEVRSDGLFIRDVEEDDRGEYFCKAWQVSDVFSSTKEIVLTLAIRHKPKSDLYKEVNFVYAYMNDKVNLSCIAEATPPAKFAWYRDKSPISASDENYEIYAGEHSSYLNLQVDDTEVLGEYVCIASNKEGKLEVKITLSLGNKADPPAQVTVRYANTTNFEMYISNETLADNSTEKGKEQDDDETITDLSIQGYNIQFISRLPADIKVEDLPPELWDDASEYDVDVSDDMVYWIPGNFTDGQQYLVRVASLNDIGLSEYTSPVEFTASTVSRLIPSGIFLVPLVIDWSASYFF